MRNISKHHFSGGIVLQNSIMDTHFSTAEREIERERERERQREREREERETEAEADQNRMVVDVRKGAIKIFHFAEIVN